MIAARHKDELRRREPERAASGVHRAVPHRDWTAQAIADEAACARPTNWAPPPLDVATPTIETASPMLGSFEDVLLAAERFDAELEEEAEKDLSRELAWARGSIDELSAQLVAETERRRGLESELDDAREAAAAYEQRLQEMSRSHYDTLSRFGGRTSSASTKPRTVRGRLGRVAGLVRGVHRVYKVA